MSREELRERIAKVYWDTVPQYHAIDALTDMYQRDLAQARAEGATRALGEVRNFVDSPFFINLVEEDGHVHQKNARENIVRTLDHLITQYQDTEKETQ